MGIKSFLAGAEAKGRSLVPLDRRLKAADNRFNQSTARLVRIKAKIAAQDLIIANASNALELSVSNEASAENRIANATGARETAAAKSDLTSAEKLSAKSRKTIEKAEWKLKPLNADLKATRERQSARAVESANLSEQLKAQRAAGPTRLEKAKSATSRAKTRLQKVRTATSKPKAPAKAKPKATAKPKAKATRRVTGKTTLATPAAKIKITGPGPVVRKLKLKKGDTFEVKAGKVSRGLVGTPKSKLTGRKRGNLFT